MIRFVDVSKALADDEDDVKPAFSFFDTVTGKFVELDGQHVFESEEELRLCHLVHSGLYYTHEIERLIWTIPDDFDRLLRDVKKRKSLD